VPRGCFGQLLWGARGRTDSRQRRSLGTDGGLGGGSLAGQYFLRHRPPPGRAAFGAAAMRGFEEAARQFGEFLAEAGPRSTSPGGQGKRVRPAGLGYGARRAYGERPPAASSRAACGPGGAAGPVGTAAARVPRVHHPLSPTVGAAGRLTGYAGGLDRERASSRSSTRALRAGRAREALLWQSQRAGCRRGISRRPLTERRSRPSA